MDYLSKFIGWLMMHWMDVKSNWRKTDDPMALGRAWSKAFVALLVLLAIVPYSSGGAGWELKIWTLIKSRPNEIGDTLAGIAGTLAFLWIIVTVQLQSRELKAQREELELAREEYRRMANAQNEQVAILQKQSEVYVGERERLKFANEREMLNQNLESMASLFAGNKRIYFDSERSGSKSIRLTLSDRVKEGASTVEERDQHIREIVRNLKQLIGKHSGIDEDGSVTRMFKFTDDELKQDLSRSLELTIAQIPRLSKVDRIRIGNLGLIELAELLKAQESAEVIGGTS